MIMTLLGQFFNELNILTSLRLPGQTKKLMHYDLKFGLSFTMDCHACISNLSQLKQVHISHSKKYIRK